MSKDTVRRAIRLEGTGLSDLELSKATKIKGDGLGRIYLEELPDGTWRLTYTESTIPDITKLEAMRIIREGDKEEERG